MDWAPQPGQATDKEPCNQREGWAEGMSQRARRAATLWPSPDRRIYLSRFPTPKKSESLGTFTSDELQNIASLSGTPGVKGEGSTGAR